MSSFIIEGGRRLRGEIIPQGAKNEALEVICATLLTPGQVTIHNVPNILDVNNKEYDYQMGVYYMDIIAECEKLGDYVVNVVEASSDIKEKKAS